MINSVNIIGYGNVGRFLEKGLAKKVEIITIYSRNTEGLKKNPAVQFVNNLENLGRADLNIIAIKDDAIAIVLEGLDKEVPTVHTSGSIGLDAFYGFEKCGILYPLQTFSKDYEAKNLNFPFLVESEDDNFKNNLIDLCSQVLGMKAIVADSEKRARIHLSAVFINNFYNHLAFESEEILKTVGEDLTLLKPLMEEGLSKIFNLGTRMSQTGPAVRGDGKVIDKHLNSIKDQELKEVYRLITQLIQDRFNT